MAVAAAGLTDLELAVVVAVATTAIAILGTYIFARRSYKATEASDATVAAAEIRGLAVTIREIHEGVGKLAQAVQDVATQVTRADMNATGDTPATRAGMARGLVARATENAEEKRAIGNYLRRYIPPGAVLAVDCGTVAAWTYHEILHEGPTVREVFTNNVLVAMMTEHRFTAEDDDDLDHPMLADEEPSVCNLVGGRYYPGYGATLERSYGKSHTAAKLSTQHYDLVIVGTTSFRIQDGPRGKAPENRRFKALLMRAACNNDRTVLAVVLESHKIGLSLGEPCDTALWTRALERSNTLIVVGGVPNHETGDVVARLRQEAATLRRGHAENDWRAQLIVLGSTGVPSSRYSVMNSDQ